METTTGQVNVEEFKLWLTRQKTTRELFRWNVTAEVAMQLLCEAYMREVVLRGSNSDMGENTLSYLQAVADMMTAKSTKCGILLCGNCGNGKTTTMNAFITMCKYMDLLEARRANFKNEIHRSLNIQQTSARRLTQVAKDENCMNEAKKADVLCIDDLGLEPTEVLDFGNAINPVIEIMEHRYRQQLFTFITTNLTPKQIREKYGDRIADRFNETMKSIVYTNPTFRR